MVETAPVVETAPAPRATSGRGAWAGAGAAAAGGSGRGRGRGSSRAPLVLLGVVVLVAVAALVAMLLGGEDEPGGTGIAAGEQRAFTVPEDGEWELVIEVPAGVLVVDVRGDQGFDPVAALVDGRGQELDRNDDRSMEQLEQYGGGVFDSLIERQLPAGTYRVVVTGFAGQGGSGQISFPVVGG